MKTQMTFDQWQKLSATHQAELWNQLTPEERAAIVLADPGVERRVAGELAKFLSSSDAEQKKQWPELTSEQRMAVIAHERDQRLAKVAAKQASQPYERPSLCGMLYLLALISFVGGLFLIAKGEMSGGAISMASCFSLVVWAQMLDHIAQVAFYSRKTVELLKARLPE
jgi:hypothetical protein